MSLVTVVGNPRAGSRTREVAHRAADALAARLGYAGPRDTVDLSALAGVVLSPGAHPALEIALELVAEAEIAIYASPTYKASYTGLLKAFLDRLPGDALAGQSALPLLVMADPKHSLAVETHFRPLLVELGAHVPTPGLAVAESRLADPALLDDWAARVAPQIQAGAVLR
ncbi:NAD(P)H-dependent oxidoreductase [Nonomuraea sp. NPDC050310]|uniref:NADPH-dependent FMN reductase n=1 Tax=unclassified Nonomuraea TaxID=2593643 RepID=UPI0033DD10B3